MNETSETSQPLSAILAELTQHPGLRITLAELAERFGGRALGALLFVLGVACTLPLPPGATTIFGAPLLLLALQLLIGASKPWLPAVISRQSIAMADLRKNLPKAIRTLQRVESFSRPRFGFLFGPVGDRVIGLICTLLACVLILPIPLGNILPALAVSALTLSMVQRDGLLALLGYALTITSVSVLVLAFRVIASTLERGLQLMTAG